MVLLMLGTGLGAYIIGPMDQKEFKRFVRQFHPDHLPESFLASTDEFIPLGGLELETYPGYGNKIEEPATIPNQLNEPVWQVYEVVDPVITNLEEPIETYPGSIEDVVVQEEAPVVETHQNQVDEPVQPVWQVYEVENPTTERVYVQQAPEELIYTSTQLPIYPDDLAAAVTELNEQSVRPPYGYEQPARPAYEYATETNYPVKNPEEFLFRVPDEELFGSAPPRFSDEEYKGNSVGFRREYAKIRSLFDDSAGYPKSPFPDRIFGSPPTPAQLGFPAVGSTEGNWHFDIDWDGLFGSSKRRKRDSSLPPPTNAHSRKDIEYEGPYLYTQLFGPVSIF